MAKRIGVFALVTSALFALLLTLGIIGWAWLSFTEWRLLEPPDARLVRLVLGGCACFGLLMSFVSEED
jgi:ABC-type sugar transport system permease subunit